MSRSLIVALGILLGVVSGCGSPAAPSSAGSPAGSASSATSPAPAPPGVPPSSTESVPLVGAAPTTPAEAVTSLVTQLGSELAPEPGGTDLGGPSFTQCDAAYPSDEQRTARSLVLRGGSSAQQPALSVEAVAYSGAAAAQSALAEVRSATASCGYVDLDPADQDGLSVDRIARTVNEGGRTSHLLVVRRGQVIAVVIGSDTVVADATARTMTLYLDSFSAAATGA